MSDVCGKYMYEKFNEIVEDTRRMFAKVKIILVCFLMNKRTSFV
jgi:hypothetical protein